MNPDTLRELAANKQSVHFTHVLAAADAWEARERAFETQQFLIGTIEDERDALRQRLEVAMRILALYNCASEIAQKNGSLFALVTADCGYAALAAGEET